MPNNAIAAQKKTVAASERLSERVRELRVAWEREKQPALAKRQVWFLDETGVSLRLARTYARAFGGARAFGFVPKNYGESVTVLGALNASGQIAAMEVRGATNEAVMLAFINEVLSKAVSPGDVVVLDNLSAHKTAKVQAAFAQIGVEAWYLPPYSPDLNPIEMCWSKLKTNLRAKAARTYEALSEAISAALQTITAADAKNWAKHCGYV